jgi:polysaccharide deacetylase family protein (PEP-CTERM system associated)
MDAILSFDVEEHYRIEAAVNLCIRLQDRRVYAQRMEAATNWLLEQLAEHNQKATFFVVGQIARTRGRLIRAMVDAGHEVASHSWDHRRVHRFTPASFREDVRASKDALEQAAGAPVVGFRAPTFSIMHETGWAIDVLAELGMRYDSSIFPVRHDRYGVPDAPRTPFMALGESYELLELPLVTWRCLGWNLPVAGGGYFRLFPLNVMERGLRQMEQLPDSCAMLYFHPWEFDADQPRLPLGRLSKFRTYVGMNRTRQRLRTLMGRYTSVRAVDVVEALEARKSALPRFCLRSAIQDAVAPSRTSRAA